MECPLWVVLFVNFCLVCHNASTLRINASRRGNMVDVLEKDEVAARIEELDEKYDRALDDKDLEKAGNIAINSIAESFEQAMVVLADIEEFFKGENLADLPPNDLMLIHLEGAIPVIHWTYYSLIKFGIFRSGITGNMEIKIPRSLSNEEIEEHVVDVIKAEGLDNAFATQAESILETTLTTKNLLVRFVDEFGKISKTGSMKKVDKILEEISSAMPENIIALRTAFIFLDLGPHIASSISKNA